MPPLPGYFEAVEIPLDWTPEAGLNFMCVDWKGPLGHGAAEGVGVPGDSFLPQPCGGSKKHEFVRKLEDAELGAQEMRSVSLTPPSDIALI